MSRADEGARPGLCADDARLLLESARAAMHKVVCGGDASEFAEARGTETLQQSRGAFVTLHTHERSPRGTAWRLRGCIGQISPASPLIDTVRRMACKAAMEDPRFAPVSSAELPELRISISVLSPMEAIDGPGALTVGIHGVQLVLANKRSVYLPQVATEQGWDADELVQQAALKAGLPRAAWREAELYRFTAEHFEEPRPQGEASSG